MKILDHTLHILNTNSNILIPVFFHVIAVQTIISYVANSMGIQDPETLIWNMSTLLPQFISLLVISTLLILIVDSFFISMTLSMIFEAWKKGKTTLDWSHGTKSFTRILSARIIFGGILLTLLLAFILPIMVAGYSVILAIIFGGILIFAMIAFYINFFWINEAIVAKGREAVKAFALSRKTTLKNFTLTIRTILLILAFSLITHSIVNIFAFANNIFLTTLVVLLASIFLRAVVSILKIVSFLQAK